MPALPNTQPQPTQQPIDYNYTSFLGGNANQDVGANIDPRLIRPVNTTDQYRLGPGSAAALGGLTAGPITQAQATLQNVDPNQLVATQVNQLTDADSAYMRRADLDARQFATRRGLTNSSIAAGAARGAAIDRALPIASADAARYGRVGDLNQQAENQANLTNAQNSAQLGAAGLGATASIRGALINNQGALDRLREGANLEGITDLRRHIFGQEIREDQQRYEGSQRDIDRAIQNEQFWANYGGNPLQWAAYGLDQQRLQHGINLDWANYQGSPFQWANLTAQTYTNNIGPIWDSVAGIYNNPNISAEEQNAAVRNLLGFVPNFNRDIWNAIPPEVIGGAGRTAAQVLPPMPNINIGG